MKRYKVKFDPISSTYCIVDRVSDTVIMYSLFEDEAIRIVNELNQNSIFRAENVYSNGTIDCSMY